MTEAERTLRDKAWELLLKEEVALGEKKGRKAMGVIDAAVLDFIREVKRRAIEHAYPLNGETTPPAGGPSRPA